MISDPAVSPDGSQIAFASHQNGYWDIYLLDLTNGQTDPRHRHARLTTALPPGRQTASSWLIETYTSERHPAVYPQADRPQRGARPADLCTRAEFFSGLVAARPGNRLRIHPHRSGRHLAGPPGPHRRSLHRYFSERHRPRSRSTLVSGWQFAGLDDGYRGHQRADDLGRA